MSWTSALALVPFPNPTDIDIWQHTKEVNPEQMTACRLCGQTIHFSDEVVSKRTGKKIPLSEGSDDPHTCEKWKAAHLRYYPCRECSAPIYFDDTHISKNGKHIPLSKTTGEPHECEAASPKA